MANDAMHTHAQKLNYWLQNTHLPQIHTVKIISINDGKAKQSKGSLLSGKTKSWQISEK